MNYFHWYKIDRMALPDALFCVELDNALHNTKIKDPIDDHINISLGYSREPLTENYTQPSLIILDEEKAPEILAWITAHSKESFPLSQFARVLSKSDYRVATFNSRKNYRPSSRVQVWPSIVLGEVLALGDYEHSIEALPLSRAQATFSNTIAKISAHYSDVTTHELCIDRMRSLEKSNRFITRSTSVLELSIIWKAARSITSDKLELKQLIDFSVTSDEPDLFNTEHHSEIKLSQYRGLLSDSVEERILEFRRLIKAVDLSSMKQGDQAILSLACAAFLVGRSTSHLFLLKEIGRSAPCVYVWFGLIAGMLGPKYWDVDWSRAAKGIEKNLRSTFTWEDPSPCDLSWVEYEWLNRTYKNRDPFQEIPKLLPKVLSIEIVPGVTCQLRLLNVHTGHNQTQDVPSQQYSLEIEFLKKTLSEFIALADKSRSEILHTQTRNIDSTLKSKSSRAPREKHTGSTRRTSKNKGTDS